MSSVSGSSGIHSNSGVTPSERPAFLEGVDVRLAGTVTARDLMVHVLGRWLLVGFLTWLVMLIPMAVLAALAGVRGAAALSVLSVIVPLVTAFLSLLIPVRTSNAEFSELVDGAAEVVESAYGGIYEHIRARSVPVDRMEPRRFSSGVGRAPANYLCIAKGRMEMWVVVLASGSDLWVSWTAWVKQVPVLMPLVFVRQTINQVVQKGTDFHESLRLQEVHAVQWAVHVAVVDGVRGAVSGDVTTLVQAFGRDVPVEERQPLGTGGRAAPVPHVPPAPPPSTLPIPPAGSPGAGTPSASGVQPSRVVQQPAEEPWWADPSK